MMLGSRRMGSADGEEAEEWKGKGVLTSEGKFSLRMTRVYATLGMLLDMAILHQSSHTIKTCLGSGLALD